VNCVRISTVPVTITNPDWQGTQPGYEDQWTILKRLIASPLYELSERWDVVEYVHNRYQNWLAVMPSDNKSINLVISLSDQTLYLVKDGGTENEDWTYYDLDGWSELVSKFQDLNV
jgi:hypothetical protein